MSKGFDSIQKLSIALVFVWSACAFADDDYSAGIAAFISNDYALAQSHWLESARRENVRAMFNLGLLHDQGKLASSKREKAEQWFLLAGKGGYAAADYHHATRLSEENGDEKLIKQLLARAASQGYTPATTKLASMGGKAIGGNPTFIKNDRVDYLSEKWLLARRGSDWTIQLLAFRDQSKVRAFIDEHGLHENAAYFIDESDSGVLYKLVYGAFQSKEAATQARGKLSPVLQEHGPWLRTLAGVQDIINN